MQIRFIGDVHGKFHQYREIIRDVPCSVQVGDMGVGFIKIRGDQLVSDTNPPHYAMQKGDHRFIRGNHDNPSVCKTHEFWIPDGHYDEKSGVFYVGGATSIDRAWRTEGFDWWADEECSIEQLNTILDKYKEIRPSIVCSHEAPESIANAILAAYNQTKFNDTSRTRQALEQMLDHHQPKYWVFGHWHCSISFKRGDTTFQCLNELEFVDIETEDFK